MKHLLIVLMLLPFMCFAQETSYMCEGAAAKNISAVPSGGTAPYTFNWSGPESFTSTDSTISVSTAGVYQFTITDDNGCSAVGNHTLNVEEDPTGDLDIDATDICLNTAQVISATGVPGGYSYDWDFGSGASPGTSTNASESVSYTTGGTKTIALTISRTFTGSANGCSATCEWDVDTEIEVGSLTGGSSCSGP